MVYLSASVEQMFGYKPSEVLGLKITDFYTDVNDREKFLEALISNKGSVRSYEATMYRKDKSVMWVSTSAQMIVDESGKMIGVEGVTRDITEKKLLEAQLKESSEKYRRLFKENKNILDTTPDGILKLNEDMEIVYVNPRIKEILGVPSGEELPTIGQSIKAIASVQNAGLLPVVDSIMKGQKISIETPFTSIYNKNIFIAVRGVPLYEKDRFSGALFIVSDITEKKDYEKELFNEKERAHAILSSIHDIVIRTDNEGIILYANPVIEEHLGWTPEEIIGKNLFQTVKILKEETGELIKNPIVGLSDKVSRIYFREPIRMFHRVENKSYSIEMTVKAVKDKNKQITGAVIVLHDITELRGMAEKLSYQAAHDPLTGLLNRREFEKKLISAVNSAQEEGLTHALCYIDLDQFKTVNDTSGHLAGDELLRQIAPILQKDMRSSDILARIGGDEFALLYYGCKISKAISLAEDLLKRISAFRFYWDGRLFEIGASMGIVPVDEETASIPELLSAADSACYSAKEDGRNRTHVYDLNKEAETEKTGQSKWYNILKNALDDNLFHLYMKPFETVRSGNTFGLGGEFILGLKMDGKLIPSDVYLSVAERYRLIPDMDRWTIKNSLKAVSSRVKEGSEQIYCINISAQSLQDDDFSQFIQDAIQSEKIPPNKICFEVSEMTLNANGKIYSFLDSLKKFGCLIALDKFGRGLGSISSIKRFSFDLVKIDGDLISVIHSDPVSRIMLDSLIKISEVLKFLIVAESVENDETLDLMMDMGVHFVQGPRIGLEEEILF